MQNAIARAVQSMISVSEEEMDDFLSRCEEKSFGRHEWLGEPGIVPEHIYFICEGLVRIVISDPKGAEHTIHFATENQFIADYTAFMLRGPSQYGLQALEKTQAVVLPRKAVEWGYSNMREGEKLGRLIAEYYFIYQDNRIRNLYSRTPSERYNAISEVFPNIHNRVPQHMIASYLGITPVHLSRLKRATAEKERKKNS